MESERSRASRSHDAVPVGLMTVGGTVLETRCVQQSLKDTKL